MTVNSYFAKVFSTVRKFGDQWNQRWARYEPYLFAALLVINLVPVFGVAYFYTGDGPAHLYNAHIIAQLLLEDTPAIAAFFELHSGLIPNLGGHTLLTTLSMLISASLAEKLVYGLCLVLLPLGFRYLVKQLNPESVAWTLVIFPLAHNFCFYIGFQSFCIGLGLMFFALGCYFSAIKKGQPIQFVWFGIMLFLTAYFHLFTAVLVGMVVFIDAAVNRIRNGSGNRNLLWTGLASLPTVIFCGVFVVGNTTGHFEWNQAALSDQLRSIWEGVPIITLDSGEKTFSVPFNILLLLGFLTGIYHRSQIRQFRFWDFALITTGLCMLLYFILPDEMASGGFVSVRLLLSFFLFLALWVVLSMRKSGFALLLMLGFIIQNAFVVAYHHREADKLSDDVAQMVAVVPYIPEGSVVIPINYSPHWLQYNIGLYPGTDHELIILDNYEAAKSHFPIQWVEGQFPGDRLGNFTTSNAPLLKLEPYESETGERIDAIIRWKYHPGINDSLTQKTNALLDSMFTRIDIPEARDVELHLRKSH